MHNCSTTLYLRNCLPICNTKSRLNSRPSQLLCNTAESLSTKQCNINQSKPLTLVEDPDIISLSDVFIFMTGGDTVPAFGFKKKPIIEFYSERG